MDEVHKQRGYYSEFIAPDVNVEVQKSMAEGPADTSIFRVNSKQKIPRAVNPTKIYQSALQERQKKSKASMQNRTSTKENSVMANSRLLYTERTEPIHTTGLYSKQDEGVADAEPKVFETYDPIPGRVPRKVEIDRKKKEYRSYRIEDLLAEAGVNKDDEPSYLSWLQLELFDDETFDDYTPQEWMDKARSSKDKDKQLALYGKGCLLENGKHVWKDVLINSYYEPDKEFVCLFKGTNEKVRFKRIDLWFDIEDPRKFVQRVKKAHELRKKTDSEVRYNFYVDNMSKTDVNQMDTEQKNRLYNKAKEVKSLKNQKTIQPNFEENLKTEAAFEYERTMNKIIFNEYFEEANPDLYENYEIEIPEEPEKPVPYFGYIDMPKNENAFPGDPNSSFEYPATKKFGDIFKDFVFSSLFIKEEVISAIQDIKTSCLEIGKKDLFDIQYKDIDRIEGFRQKQGGNISMLATMLKEGWISDLTVLIRNKFNNVGRGWFNLKDANNLTYEFGKLKRFLTQVRLMMQDTLFTLIHKGLHDFKEFLLSFIPDKVIIDNQNEVQNKFTRPVPDRFKSNSGNALIKIDMIRVANQQEFNYSIRPSKIVDEVLDLVSKGLEEMEKIPDLEPKILDNLFKARRTQSHILTPQLPKSEPTVPQLNEKPRRYPDENKWVWDLYEEFRSIMEKAVLPLKDFTQTFDRYKPLISINPDEYIMKLESEDGAKSAEGIQAEIEKWSEAERKVKEEIPEEIIVSCFLIDCRELIRFLTNKYQEMNKRLIDLMARKAREKIAISKKTIAELSKRLRTIPDNIEELTELKHYIKEQLQIDLQKMRNEANSVIEIHDILESYEYKIPREDMLQKWAMFKAPADIEEIVEDQGDKLKELTKDLLDEMIEEQETFAKTIKQKEDAISRLWESNKEDKIDEYAENMESFKKVIEKMKEQAAVYTSREGKFDRDMTDYSKLEKLQEDLMPYYNLWTQIHTWKKNGDKWMKDTWEKVDHNKAENFIENGYQVLVKAMRNFSKEDPNFKEIIEIANKAKKEIEEFRPKVPLLVSLKREGMQERHWNEITKLLAEEGKVINPKKPIQIPGKKAVFNLEGLIYEGLMDKLPICISIGEKAYKENEISKDLVNMANQWEETNFILKPHGQTYLISNFEEIEIIVDEHLNKTQNLLVNPYKEEFAKDIEEWNSKLVLISDTIEEWAKLQRNWKYLSPIFDSPDIAKQMATESNNFKRVDANWKHTMNHTKAISKVKRACTEDPVLEKFRESNRALELIQMHLREYLEKKRSAFGRFYFLSDDDLLSILSQTKEVERVQDHLRKVFESIALLDFDPNKKITAMNSVEKEKVMFRKVVDPNHKQVEDWMSEVEREMKGTVRKMLEIAIIDYPDTYDPNSDRNNWLLQHPGQCVLNASQVKWTAEVEDAIKKKQIPDYCKLLNSQLNKLIKIERGNLDSNRLITIEALIVIDVHALDVTESLRSVDNLDSYEWISQLRYYWEQKDNTKPHECRVKCIQTDYQYGYEYLGNSTRLVITPLTDRCYITLMGALSLNLGGAPAGPAGTGKTESTKDLAKALAKQCVVFNCQESMDYHFVGKFFKGLACSGAWCCFDEFNRINLEVLSVIAQQLQELFTAKAKEITNISFEGSEIKLQPTFCVFITMNPGYAGRTELPDNLKALFRPVAMMVPDYALIAEIKLFSFGFSKEMGRELARKLVETFRLSSEQLSSQNHYDYGMRAVTSVINAAGLLKRNPNMSHLQEDQLILKAIRDVNVPKFLKDDIPLFKYIIKDLFPDTPNPQDNYGELSQAIIDACIDKENPIQPTESFTTKIYQLYDTIQVRHGLMLVGPTGGGKTTNYRTLQKAMSSLAKNKVPNYSKINVEILNPKSVTMPQLYGESKDMNWQEGIIERTMEKAINNQHDPEKGTENFWIMFDGPVDALWIESMNTVLDDNKKLCLSSGKVMILSKYITMMFEVEDLLVASPATVSRCGMVYMEPKALGVEPLIESFYQKLPPPLLSMKGDILGRLRLLMDTFVLEGIELLRRDCKEIFETSDSNIVSSLLKMLWIHIKTFFEVEGIKKKPAELEKINIALENYFIFCFIWSFCSTLNEKSQPIMDEFVKSKLKQLNIPQITMPLDSTIYDYEYLFLENRWREWNEKFKEFTISPKQTFSDIVVPTIDYCRVRNLFGFLLTNKMHTLVVGQTGTGKTVDALSFLGDGLNDRYTSMSVVLSAQTSANQLQDTICQQIGKRKKGVFGPDSGKTMICLIDDLNMPKKEEYGAQPPIELLRQYLDHKAWFIIQQNKEYIVVEDLVLLGAMGPPGGARTYITNRFVRHMNTICINEMSDNQIHYIFKTILDHFLKRLPDEPKAHIDTLISTAINVFHKVRMDLRPIPSKIHYSFNLRDIAKVLQGASMVSQNQIKTPVALARLWYHENMRVYHDRLTTVEDRLYLKDLLKTQASNFGIDPEDLFKSDYSVIEGTNEASPLDNIIFCDFLHSTNTDNPDYVLVEDPKKLEGILEKRQEKYNSDKPKDKLNLVMFSDACEHVARICRVLRQPQGSVLLLGVGGSGRQSLTKLAVHIRDMDLKGINVIKGYNMNRWREDLKVMIYNIIDNNKPVCFMVVDTQIIDEQMVEDVNCLLNSGWVVGLPFTPDETERLDDIGRKFCIESRIPQTKINIYSTQVAKVRKNLHISFAMSPLSDSFRTRMRMFPAFINCCTIDWFTAWPDDALIRVGTKEIEPLAEELGISNNLGSIVEMFKVIHKSVEVMTEKYRQEANKHNYVTPRSFLELLSLFKTILVNKKELNLKSIKRLESGIAMLKDANSEVQKLDKFLQEETPKLEKADIEMREEKIILEQKKADAQEKRERVNKESQEAKNDELEALEIGRQVKEKFDQGQVTLTEAAEKLKKLTKAHLSEFQAYTNPPLALKTLAIAVNLLMEQDKNKLKGILGYKTKEERETANWKEFKTMCRQGDFLEKMRLVVDQFDQREKFEKLIEYIKTNKEIQDNWQLSYFDSKSFCGGQIFLFIDSMINCFEIDKLNIPLREKNEEMKEVVRKKKEDVAVKTKELEEVERSVRELQEGLDTKNRQLEELKATLESNKQKLERASNLTTLLGDEDKRWQDDVKKFSEAVDFIPGNCLVSAGMVCYSGPFTVEYRSLLERGWIEQLDKLSIPYTQGMSMKKYLANPIKLLSWNVYGLPKDDTSVENGVILEYTQRWPLMIDPQTQANKFIKRMLKDIAETNEPIKASSPQLMKVVEHYIQFGKQLLVENVGLKLDPALEPVLQKQIIKEQTGSRAKVINIGDKTIPYHDGFQFYMTTTMPNPHYSPEICAKVTLINFGITMKGLEEQMLAIIVILEDRKLEDSKNEIVKSNAEDNKELVSLEDKILSSLADSQGKILNDDSIIDQLRSAKNKSKLIAQRVTESKVTEQKIDEAREIFKPVAFRSSVLFFCIVDLANIDPMYQYSLQWYEYLFKSSVDNTPANKIKEERLKSLKENFTKTLYRNVCRSLFGKHKLLFSFLMTTRLLEMEKEDDGSDFDIKAYRHLLTGPTGDVKIPPRAAEWINSETNWRQIFTEIYGLESLPQFKGIVDHFLSHIDDWKPIYDADKITIDLLPTEWQAKLKALDFLLLVKAIRPDKVINAVQQYVLQKMKKEDYIDMQIVKLDECFQDSSCSTPLIFILSQGSDPKADFDAFAASKKMTDIRSISLGQGQGKKATDMINAAKQEGRWVLLQNCHLAASWMGELEAHVEALSDPMVHKDFRLWMTSMPSSDFRISILQNSVKMTIEPPQGIKDNLKKSYESMKEEIDDKEESTTYKKLVYGLCFFHAIVQDRRKFGPIGWNIPYEFTFEDLEVCKKQLKMFLRINNEIPFDVIRTICADINYGGRVTDKKDARLIQSLIHKFVNEEVLKDNYEFGGSAEYISPPVTSHADYMIFIGKLPLNDVPEVFGLHSNAAITYAQAQTRTLLENLLSIQPKSSGGSSDTRGSIIANTIDQIKEKTPEPFDMETIKAQYPPDDYNESMNSVLVQEVIRCNNLLINMKEKLHMVKLAIKGEVIMSEDLEKIANSFYIQQVPSEWQYPLGFLSLKPLNAWIEELNQRVKFFSDWISNGQPKSFWFGGFFFPQAFITGTLQNYARQKNISIDQLNFEFEVMRSNLTHKNIQERPESGVMVHGIYLEGARWDPNIQYLNHSRPKELYSELPLIHLKPIVGEVNTVRTYNPDRNVFMSSLQGRIKSRYSHDNRTFDQLRHGLVSEDKDRIPRMGSSRCGCLPIAKNISLVKLVHLSQFFDSIMVCLDLVANGPLMLVNLEVIASL